MATTELRIFNDSFNNIVVKFRSDAPQHFVTALEFSGEWYVIKHILKDLGYVVIECPNEN